MEELYLGWVEQLEKGLEQWGTVSVPGKYRLVLVSGMGGSGIVGDYVAALASRRNVVPVIVSKSHLVPEYIGREDLVFIVSYSGNTLETRRSFEEAYARGSRIVIVSSDGLLEEAAKEKNIPYVGIIRGIAPRTALPHMLYGVLGVLDSSGYPVVSRREAEEAYDFFKESVKDAVDKAHELAGFIAENKGLLIVATHTPLEALALRVKNEFNENSKIPVKVEVAPEWMHNDIVGWEKPYENRYTVVTITDPEDRVGSGLVGFMEKIYRMNGFPTYNVSLKGNNLLEKLLYGSLLFGYASVKLARIRGVDPLVTETIRRYKEEAPSIFG